MQFPVPQYIDIEDKIAFRLTAKQLGWFALAGAILFFVWQFFTMEVFVISAILVGGLAVGFAFFQPFGMTMPQLVMASFQYLIKPKKYFWYKRPEKDVSAAPKKVKTSAAAKEASFKRKRATLEDLEKISDVLDRGGEI